MRKAEELRTYSSMTGGPMNTYMVFVPDTRGTFSQSKAPVACGESQSAMIAAVIRS